MAMNFDQFSISTFKMQLVLLSIFFTITITTCLEGEQNTLDQDLSFPNSSPIFSEEGDDCTTNSGISGKCVRSSQCDNIKELIRSREPPVTCGFGVYEEIICCPTKTDIMSDRLTTIPFINMTSTTPIPIKTSTGNPANNTVDLTPKQTQELEKFLNNLFKPDQESTPATISKSGSIGGMGMSNPFLKPKKNNTDKPAMPNPWLSGMRPTHEKTTTRRPVTNHKDRPITFPTDDDEEVYVFPNTNRVNQSTTTTTTTQSPVLNRSKARASVIACNEIDSGLSPLLSPHIIGGLPVDLGEYPHMAAIGYGAIGSDEYDFNCGGTLIAPRFVLTAAHCVIRRDSSPSIVRLGFTDMDNREELEGAVEKSIAKVHIHPDYKNSRSYNDIAILELDSNVTYSSRVYPTCLYTEPNDPPEGSILTVTGWGTINVKTRMTSKRLLKATLSIRSIQKCNASYVEQSIRQLPHGLDQSQICAFDPEGLKDACQGDSGGPLNLVVDESLRQYRVVGITSAGFSCGTSTPSLYTRVSSYLDYIESVVWPKTDPS